MKCNDYKKLILELSRHIISEGFNYYNLNCWFWCMGNFIKESSLSEKQKETILSKTVFYVVDEKRLCKSRASLHPFAFESEIKSKVLSLFGSSTCLRNVMKTVSKISSESIFSAMLDGDEYKLIDCIKQVKVSDISVKDECLNWISETIANTDNGEAYYGYK